MRQLLAQGKYAEAMAIDLGTNVGQSDWAFTRFDTALRQVIAINQNYFNQQISDALSILRPFLFIRAGALIMLIRACIFGMKPRLDEYWL